MYLKIEPSKFDDGYRWDKESGMTPRLLTWAVGRKSLPFIEMEKIDKETRLREEEDWSLDISLKCLLDIKLNPLESSKIYTMFLSPRL